MNYGFEKLAEKARKNRIKINEEVYDKTGKMTEKYDVFNENLETSGENIPIKMGLVGRMAFC